MFPEFLNFKVLHAINYYRAPDKHIKMQTVAS